MRIEPILIHRATVLVPGQENGKDRYGRPVYQEPVTKQIKCRLDHLQQRLSSDEEGRDVVWSYVLFTGPNESFDFNMKVREVTDEQGNIVVPGEFSIVDIFPAYRLNKLHHYEVQLSRGDGSVA